MAVDAGTGSVRAVVFGVDGTQVGCVQREWTHREDPRWPGSMDFDWTANWGLACACVRGVLEETGIAPAEIAAVSTTCMREGILLYDREGNEIWACANVDARSSAQVGQLKALAPALEREIYRKSGQTYALGALPRLLWVRDNLPEVYARTARLGMFNDWLIYRLTGKLAVEPSNGSTTGIMDLQSRNWLPEIAERCGLRADIFPDVVECGTLFAQVSARGAAETGLREGTPVVAGGGDCQLGAIGVGAVRANQAAVFGGSFWQYEFNTAAGAADPDCRVRVNCHAVPGLWQYEALAFKPGLVIRWFRDGFCQAEIAEAARTGRDPYDLMNEGAGDVPPGCYGMQCCFSDTMNFLNWKHASPTFTNFLLEPEKFNKFTFYRAILENTALLVRGHIELVKEAAGREPEELIFAGGAAKSPLWSQIVADVTERPVKVPAVKEATALGAAILAGCGVGLYPSLDEAVRRTVKWDRTFRPNPDNAPVYRDLYDRWRKLYPAQLALCDQKLTRNLWIAPGL